MSIASFRRMVQAQWEAFTAYLWPQTSEQRTQEEIQRLGRELQRRHEALIQRQQQLLKLRERVQLLELRAAERSNDPEAPVHRAVRRNRLRLQARENRYEQKQRAFLQLKELRNALTRGKVVVLGDESSTD